MRVHDIQSSFAGGEFAPTLQGRVDLAKYKTGLKTCRNMIPGNHGEVYNRQGMRFVHKAQLAGTKSKLIPFSFSSNDSYVLEFGQGFIAFYKNGTFVNTPTWSNSEEYPIGYFVLYGGYRYLSLTINSAAQPDISGSDWVLTSVQDDYPFYISSPYQEADLPNLKYCQSLDTLYICHPDFAPRVLTRTDDTHWTLALFPFANGPFMLQNTDDTFGMNVQYNTDHWELFTQGIPSGTKNYFTSDHVGSLFKLKQYQAEQGGPHAFTSTSTASQFSCLHDWQLMTTGNWNGTLILQKSEDGGTTWTKLNEWTSSDQGGSDHIGALNVNTYGTEDNPDGIPFLIRLSYTYSSGTCYATLTSSAYYQYAILKVYEYVGPTLVKVTIANDVTPLAPDVTADWSEGSWSTKRGWPKTVAFFMDRLAFSGSKSEPQTVWFSKVSNYVYFGISDPLIDSDSISVNLPSRKLNNIQSILPFQNYLMLMTSEAQWTISSVSDGPITPTSVFTKMNSAVGSNGIDPLIVSDKVLFIETLGSTLREMNYDFIPQVFKADPISILSSHLFEGHDIVSMAYAQEPKSIVWFVRDDGILISLSYIPAQELMAFAWHDTDGVVENICAIPGAYGHELWLTILRGSVRTIERMLPREDLTDPAEQYFVDAGIAYDDTPISSISGLDHLEGKTVSVLADGFVLPQKVVSGGSVSFGASYSKVAVGLPYTSDIETLNPEIPMQDGTSQGRFYQLAGAIFRLYNSSGGDFGMDEDTLADSFITRATSVPYDTPTPLFTGFYPISGMATVKKSSDPRGHLMIRQTDPLPITIVAIYPILDSAANP